jgi:hypothetical protein
MKSSLGLFDTGTKKNSSTAMKLVKHAGVAMLKHVQRAAPG